MSASARSPGRKPESSSCSPHRAAARAAAHDAPGPHAWTSTASPEWTRCRVAGPSGVWVARHASPWPSLSHGPVPMGASVSASSSGLLVAKRERTAGLASSAAIERDLHGERASATRLGVEREVTIMHARDLARKPQPEPGARRVHRRLVLDPAEACEELGLV